MCLGFRVLLTLQSSHLLNHWRHRTDVRSKCTLSKLIQDGWFFSTHTISGPELCLLRLSSAYKQFQTIIPIREREREPISCGASGNLAYNRVKAFGLTFPSSHDQNPTKRPYPLCRNLLEGSQLVITPDKIPRIQGNLITIVQPGRNIRKMRLVRLKLFSCTLWNRIC